MCIYIFAWIKKSDFTDISILWFYGYIRNIGGYFFTNIDGSENYLKFIGMLEKTKKNDKISKNTHFKVIL